LCPSGTVVGIDGHNDVGWLPLPYPVLGITVTTFRRFTGQIIECDIAITTAQTIAVLPVAPGYSGPVPDDFESIILHEEGHLAGLNHVPDPNAVMYPFYAAGTIKRVLTDSETDGLVFLYPTQHSASAWAANPKFDFSSIDFPGANLTYARGINDNGDIVGAYSTDGTTLHALLVKGGQYIPLAPSAVLGTNYSEARGINAGGEIIGYFFDDAGINHGFVLSNKGVLRQLDVPGAGDTTAFGINNSGTVVGVFDDYDSQGNFIATHGFIWDGTNFSVVDYPGAGDTYLTGINDRGDVVGEWDDGFMVHGFVRTSAGQFVNFDALPGRSSFTDLRGINATGEIVGLYSPGGHAFRLEGATTLTPTLTPIFDPNGTNTTAWGINSSGRIVGNSFGLDRKWHGYLALPK
jgi:probable HAF family extracellular repeat protein